MLSKSRNNAGCGAIRQHAAVKLAQQFVDKGQTDLEKGEFDEAMWSADAAIKLDPANHGAAKLKLLAAQLKPRLPTEVSSSASCCKARRLSLPKTLKPFQSLSAA